jgi:lipopolysaccharide transport system permease protein
MFQRGTMAAMTSFQRYRRLTNVFSIPLLIIPIVGVAALWIDVVTWTIVNAALFVYFFVSSGEMYFEFTWQIVLIPLSIIWILCLVAVIALFTAPMYVRARDIRMIMRMVIPFFMFVSPIMYPLAYLEAKVGDLVYLNPLTAPVELFRAGLTGQSGIGLFGVLVSALVTAVFLVAGLFFLSRVGKRLVHQVDSTIEEGVT